MKTFLLFVLALPLLAQNPITRQGTAASRYIVVDVGGDDAYSGNPSGNTCPASLSAPLVVELIVATTNTGAATLDFCGLGALEITTATAGTDLDDGDLVVGKAYTLVWYDASPDLWLVNLGQGGGGMGTGDATSVVSVSFSATPTFTADSNTINVFAMTLTDDVTSCTIASATAGQIIILALTQDGSGGHTFACGGFTGLGSIGTGADDVSVQVFHATAANAALADGSMSCLTCDPGIEIPGLNSGALIIEAADDTTGTRTLKFPDGSTDFSATGGASQVLRQSSAGAAITVSQLECADLSDAGAGCSGGGGSVTKVRETQYWSASANTASGFICLTSGGCTVTTGTIAGTSPQVITFADSSTQGGVFRGILPTSWSSGDGLTFNVRYYADDGNFNSNVVIRASVVCIADTEGNFGPTFNSTSSVTSAVGANANRRTTVTFSSLTLTGCAAGEEILIKVERVGGDGSDSHTGNIRVYSFEMSYLVTLE